MSGHPLLPSDPVTLPLLPLKNVANQPAPRRPADTPFITATKAMATKAMTTFHPENHPATAHSTKVTAPTCTKYRAMIARDTPLPASASTSAPAFAATSAAAAAVVVGGSGGIGKDFSTLFA